VSSAKEVQIDKSTRNAWQSQAYSPLGAVVSPPSEYLWKTPPECLTAPPHSEHRWTKRGNNYRPRPYNFFRLKLRGHLSESHQISTRCTEWLPIKLLKSKLWYSNPLRFVSKCQSKVWRRSILTSAKRRQSSSVIIATSLWLSQNLFQFYNQDTSIYRTEIVVAINLVHAEIFGTKCQFLPSCSKRYRLVLVISGVTGPILIKFAQYVENILSLNPYES